MFPSPDGDLHTPCRGACSTSHLESSKLYSLDATASRLPNTPLNNQVTLPTKVLFNNTTNHFLTLLDTCAIQSNYVRSAQVERLKSDGYSMEKFDTEVCAAFDNCEHSSKLLVLDIVFNDDDVSVLNKAGSFVVPLIFKVLDNLPFDMIIGRNDIDEYDLWYKTKHYRQVAVRSIQDTVHLANHARQSQITLFSHLPSIRLAKNKRSRSSTTDKGNMQHKTKISKTIETPVNAAKDKRSRNSTFRKPVLDANRTKPKTQRATVAELREQGSKATILRLCKPTELVV